MEPKRKLRSGDLVDSEYRKLGIEKAKETARNANTLQRRPKRRR